MELKTLFRTKSLEADPLIIFQVGDEIFFEWEVLFTEDYRVVLRGEDSAKKVLEYYRKRLPERYPRFKGHRIWEEIPAELDSRLQEQIALYCL